MSTTEGQPEVNTADKPGDDVEGHAVARAAGDDDDTEGHLVARAAGDDDDVEGHLRTFKAGEGHLMRSDEDDADGAPEFRA
ncbi:MAG: hypothetical protein H0V67_08940 [Geodermatophilaceae bacterium]|nr:hypothetical protein [Geodermatophilaceae bacterium]